MAACLSCQSLDAEWSEDPVVQLYMPKGGLMFLMSRLFRCDIRTRCVCEGVRVAEEAAALWS